MLKKTVILPASKSESNRALMIAAYGGFPPDVANLSDSQDTKVLREALMFCHERKTIDIADCGTAARFMTTYLACHDGDWLLTGTDRMKQRPIKPLVDVLRKLGSSIEYVENEGFLPLKIHGKSIAGGKASLDISQSSQFASSLLLAAPMWRDGLELELIGNFNSVPYLDMTIAMMCHFSAQVERKGSVVTVKPKPYRPNSFTVEADWSAASYWYELAALSEACEISLMGLCSPSTVRRAPSPASLQGDAIIADWMQAFGVMTTEMDSALVLTKKSFTNTTLSFDFSNTPDLFPMIVATCAGLQRHARFTGIANLMFKESDREGAMQAEVAKIGAKLNKVSDNEAVLIPGISLPYFKKNHPLRFDSHGDHRIVMALAPLAMKIGDLLFDHPEVVRKSYPNFWEQMDFLGF